MKKRIAPLLAVMCLLFALVFSGCSGKPTLEDYFNSDAMQTMLDTVTQQYEAQGMGVNIFAQGDEMHYEFTLKDVETTEEDRSTYTQQLQAGMDSNASTFEGIADDVKDAVSNDNVVVVVTYLDGAGNELLTQSYSADAAQ